ncbi:hypothetical protein M569_08700, partial [Genlisea aurea]
LMLLFLLSCLSFVLFSQSFLKPHFFAKIRPRKRQCGFPWSRFLLVLSRITRKTEIPNSRHGVPCEGIASLLDLPDLPMDAIFEKLSPAELCVMSMVCTSLKQTCTSNHLWDGHFKQKWGDVFGEAAYKQWEENNVTSSRRASSSSSSRWKGNNFFLGFWRKREIDSWEKGSSLMALYIALETGKFWFPAQVFNRENGFLGFALSCYDAKICYDSTTDHFIARYPSQGVSLIEESIGWNRIRAPVVDTPSNILHVSDCLNELKPDDQVEIQWRKNNLFPYGWWYGVVGHLDSCSGNTYCGCSCRFNDSLIVEFKQYEVGSRWRKVKISRKKQGVVGDEVDGYYGGIRRICREREIEKWRRFWPKCAL